MNSGIWIASPEEPFQPTDAVDIWRISLDVAGSPAESSWILSGEEQARADRLLLPAKRAQFARTRTAVRQILARYLGADPIAVQIAAAEPHRKPFVVGGGLEFNVSHCEGMALCAVTLRRRLGIDVEPVVEARPLREIAERFFHPRERAALAALPAADMVPAFYRCWTAKEALLKATGHGLHHPLDSFAVEVERLRPLRVIEGQLPAGETEDWSLESIPVGEGYAGACAVEGQPAGWRFWEWPGTIDA